MISTNNIRGRTCYIKILFKSGHTNRMFLGPQPLHAEDPHPVPQPGHLGRSSQDEEHGEEDTWGFYSRNPRYIEYKPAKASIVQYWTPIGCMVVLLSCDWCRLLCPACRPRPRPAPSTGRGSISGSGGGWSHRPAGDTHHELETKIHTKVRNHGDGEGP